MASLFGFDASTVPEQQDYSALPEGQYIGIITASEMKPTKKGDGQYLQFTFEILDGAFKGRNLWARLNLKNPNQKAVDIAKIELGAICRAVGIIKPNDSSELHNKPIMLTVEVETDDRGKQSNNITKYEAASAMTPAATSAPAGFMQPSAPGAAAAPAAPPWGNR